MHLNMLYILEYVHIYVLEYVQNFEHMRPKRPFFIHASGRDGMRSLFCPVIYVHVYITMQISLITNDVTTQKSSGIL